MKSAGEAEKEVVLVSDIMKYQPTTVRPETPIGELIDLLVEKRVTGLPVVSADRHELVGFVSEKDCIQRLLVSTYHCDVNISVRDVMRTDVLTTRPDVSITELARQMEGQKPKVYPVVDEDGRFIGVVTRAHILKALKTAYVSCQRVA